MPVFKTRDGTEIYYNDWGTGPAIMFHHGWPLSADDWDAQMMFFLAKGYRVIAHDRRGHGRSTATTTGNEMDTYADDLAALLEALQADRPVTFCGLSMGGYIAWQFAARHPDWLGRLILCDTRAAADSAEAAANRLKMADIVSKEGPEPVAWAMMPKLFAPVVTPQQQTLADLVRKMVLETDPVAIAAAHRGMAIRPDVTSLLPNLRFPTLVIVGEHDVISPPQEMRTIADAIPQARFVQIPAAGHMAPMENPAAVNRAISVFLQTTR